MGMEKVGLRAWGKMDEVGRSAYKLISVKEVFIRGERVGRREREELEVSGVTC